MIQIIDKLGNIHEVLAVKPQTFSTHPDDQNLLTVLHKSDSRLSPYVVHGLNLVDGCFYFGRYYRDYEDALGAFNKSKD
jgi:hypothetical protein